MLQAQIELRSVADLKANPRNARTHSPKQISQIAASIAEFGFTSPILIDGNDMVVAGHGRLEAAKKVGLSTVPTVSLDHLSPEQLRAYVIADNQLALKAGWDAEILSLELAELSALDLGFDLTITGFDWPDIDMAIGTPAAAVKEDPLDRIPEAACTAVTRESDLWLIGPHRLICGDSTKQETFAALLGDERAQLVFCDPPYNVPIDGHVSGLGRTSHREFAMASGEMSETEFTAFLAHVFHHLADWSVDGALHFQCMDFRHMREILDAGAAAYSELKNLCVWAKTNAGMGSLYRSQHELVFVFKAGTAPHINNVELGRHGRYRTNLWTYAGANTFSRTRDDDLAAHPTVKPTALVADAILDASHPKDIVLDAFAGSGTTLVAAHKTRRRGFGIELDPIYCDIILKRLAAVTGEEPRHAETGLLFRDLEQRRVAELNSDPAYGDVS
jgi:DNA modification methylase